MGIANINDYLARVEQAVRKDLRGAQVIMLVESDNIEREGYWERSYIVAWQREDQCGTHRVHIDSNDDHACFIGHYDMTKERAIDDALKRAGLILTSLLDNEG